MDGDEGKLGGYISGKDVRCVRIFNSVVIHSVLE